MTAPGLRPVGHDGRVALVTGAARGIGLAIAEVLAADGAAVALFDLSDTVHECAAELGERDVRAVGITGDVSSPEAVREGFAEVRDRLGSVDILVNNAAIADQFAKVTDLELSAWEQQLAVNLTGALLTSQAALPAMVETGWGRIIMISSGAAELGGVGQVGYTATKAGLLGMTRTIALEHARDGITCNALMPGLIDTDTAAAIRDDLRERIVRRIPARKMGQPEDVAYAVSWLASDRAGYVNGTTSFVSAGQELFTF